jgi:serine/threonine-protein kinase
MPAARAVRLARQACSSLAEAHEAHVVHRDVKPTNLYVTHYEDDHDFLKVLDFGVAWVAQGELDSHLTRTGVVPGTPAFMAPELRLGGRGDARSDVYSLGATLHYLVTGSPPAGPDATGAQDAGDSTNASELRLPGTVPQALRELLARCLSAEPERRPQSARELGRELDTFEALGEWTEEQARTFWQVTHPQAMVGWTAPTETS